MSDKFKAIVINNQNENFSRDINGNYRIESVNSILKNYSDLLSIGIDILDKETAQSVIRSINSNKKIRENDYKSFERI